MNTTSERQSEVEMSHRSRILVRFAIAMVSVVCTLSATSYAAAPAGGTNTQPIAPRLTNAIDLTGVWVSVVNEDWNYRMVRPPKGDYRLMQMTPEGRRVADMWDPNSDGSCLAYGAASLVRVPQRMRISWESDSVLKLETDAGQQVRRFVFGAAEAPQGRSLQGFSRSRWVPDSPVTDQGLRPAFPKPDARHSTLEVLTSNLSGGWLRRNGVPYSPDARVTEYYDRFALPHGNGSDEWLLVTTIVDDPIYHVEPFVTSTNFKREPDGSKWHPTACKS